jgi:peroxiredoxin
LALLIAVMVVAAPGSTLGVDPFADLELMRSRQPKLAPDFTVPRLGSGSIVLKELRGQVVFLNFWATWCPPCKEEMPSMERLYKRYKDRGLTMLAISIDTGAAQDVEKFVKKLGLTFPIGLDPKLEVANRYTVRALPSTFLIDGAGATVAVALGPRNWDGATAHTVVETLLRCRTTIARPEERDGQRC